MDSTPRQIRGERKEMVGLNDSNDHNRIADHGIKRRPASSENNKPPDEKTRLPDQNGTAPVSHKRGERKMQTEIDIAEHHSDVVEALRQAQVEINCLKVVAAVGWLMAFAGWLFASYR